jgi:hypothetical protein
MGIYGNEGVLIQPDNYPSGFAIGHPHQNEKNNFITDWQEKLAAKELYWYNWIFNHDDPKYVPMVFSNSTWIKYRMTFMAQKEKLHFVANEPDIDPSNFTVKEFGDVCSQLDYVCGPNISLWGHRGYDYVAECIDNDIIPYAWGIHIYNVLTLEHFIRNLNNFMEFVDSKNALRPIIVTETGAQTYNHLQQAALLEELYTYVYNNAFLDSVFWFSTYWNKSNEWGAMSLFDSTGELTPAGAMLRVKNTENKLFLPIVNNGKQSEGQRKG